MLFSIGDLITFFVVLLILAIYRALDRNNRSLEKLKRFSDRITENLSGLVEQKTAQMKELSHELQASFKTGNELIVRAGGVEGQLQGKAEQIESIQARLSEYDRALKELASMSARVDKNLLKLRDESAFVDGVSRRIGETAARLDRIEKQIPEVEKVFSARTREALESARAEATKTVEAKVAALVAASAQSEQKMKELALAVARQDAHTRQAQEQGIAALAAAVEKARTEALKTVDARVGALGTTVAQSEQKVKDFSTYISRLEARADQAQTERAAALTKMLEEARGKIMRGVEEKATALADSLAKSEQKVKEFSASVAGREARDAQLQEKRLAAVAHALQAARAELSNAVEKKAGILEEVVAKSEQTVKDFTAYVSELEARAQISEQERVAALEKSLEAAREAAVSTMEAKVASFQDTVTAVRDKAVGAVETRVAALAQGLDATRAGAVGEVEAKVSALQKTVDAATENAVGAVETRVAALVQGFDAARAGALGAAEEKVAALEKTVDGAAVRGVGLVEAKVTAFEKTLDAVRGNALSGIETRVSALQQVVAAAQDKAIGEAAARVNALARMVEEAREGALGAIEAKAQGFEKSIDKARSDAVSAVETRAASVSQGFDAARNSALVEVEKSVGALEGLVSASQRKVADFSTFISDLQARQGQIEKERVAGLTASLDAFETDLRERLAAAARRGETLEDEVFGRLSSRIQSDEAALAKSIEAVESRLADYQGDVDYRVKSLEDSTHEIDALRASLAQAMDKTAAVARAEMKELTAELAAGWKTEVAAAESLQKQMQSGMGELEARLAALKERSYQDAEKQLSAFEEEFFADLRTRSAATQQKFQAWQSEMEKRAAGFEEGLKGELAGAVRKGESLREEMIARVAAKIQSDEAVLSRSIEGVEARVGGFEAEVESRVKALEEESADVEQMRQSISQAIEQTAAHAREEIKGVFSQMTASLAEEAAAAAALQKQLQAGVAELETRWAELKTRSAQETEKKLAAFESEFFADLRARTSATQEKFTSWQSEMEKRALGFESDLNEKIAGAARKGEALKEEVLGRVTSRIQADEAAFAKSIETFETRLADYQGDVDYRVKSLEEANQDVDALRAALTQTMDEMAAGVRAEMKVLATQLAAGWKSEIVAAGTLQEQMRAGMEELGARVADLQARAYQDAEKKLSVFEEEFFADLRARSNATQEKFQTWQSELEKRALGFETDVKERIAASEESVQALRDALRVEIDKAKKDASGSLEKELAGVRDAVDAGTRKMHREIEARLKELGTGLEAGRKELTDLFEASRAEVTVWEGRARQQLSEAELAIADRISTLSSEASSSIGNIRDAFAAQKEDLLVSTNEERIALRKELAGMGEAVSSFDASLKKTTDTAMETLRSQMDTFQVESQKRMRELQTEVEGRIKEHKQQLTDTREKSEAMQDKLFGKIEESYRLLSVNLGEMDKRVKGFVAQTRLFERADTMKAGLEGAIEEMKKEMAQLQAARPEVAELEQQLARTKKTADEVSTKLTRFLSEKRRIEDMDGEFKKIITLSRDVDLKLDTLSASNDALQQIQAKIRQFEEIGKTVDGGFERLEKKKEIISVTAEGVDRNFQRLEGIEKTLQEADRTASDLASQVQNLRGEYEVLAVSKRDADSVMETVGRLGSVITDLEARLEKAQSSREWMARTETRFEEIGRQAQEQVRLLESILKAETKKEKGERGAPPLDKRETVIKLSHQGWSVQEISRVTQLSRGEVELILELAPKV
jgi:DNA repair exonuclease SbcCD ATPase subunit